MLVKDLGIIILAKDEEPRIKSQLEYLKITNCQVFVFDDLSTDKTVEIAKTFDHVEVIPLPEFENFSDKRNYTMGVLLERKFLWCLFVDADERFDPFFLTRIVLFAQDANARDFIAFKFPRINRPDGKNYPDYQVRFLKLDQDIYWARDPHEVPHRDADGSSWNLHDYIRVRKLEKCPIVHYERRKDINRPWW